MIVELVVAMLIVAGAGTVICWDSIVAALRRHRIRQSDLAVLVREKLANGKGVSVSMKLFEKTELGRTYHTETWTGGTLDPATERIFGNSDQVGIS